MIKVINSEIWTVEFYVEYLPLGDYVSKPFWVIICCV